jgi:DNA-binding PadR family transcriptional regulator
MRMMRYMILGLLRHHGARHGYALMKEIRGRTGVQLSIGNVYRELARLARAGLVRSTPNAPETDPRRAPYEITAAGIAAFEAWLAATPARIQAPFHDEFTARALFLGQADPAVGRKLIARWKEELDLQGKTLGRARDVATVPDGARDGAPLLLLPFFLRRRLAQVAVDLEFVEELDSAHERWAAAHAQPAEVRRRRPPVAQRMRSQAQGARPAG